MKSKYINLIIDLVIVILLTTGLIVLNKNVFENPLFKTFENYKNLKLIINDLIGFAEIVIVFKAFIAYINKKD